MVEMVKIDSTFKFDGGRDYYETLNAWTKVRIVKDKKREGYYVDVLMGSKGNKPHVHMGINGDGSYRFILPRNSLNSISQRAEDSNLGLIGDETINITPEKGPNSFTFKIIVNEPTRTIKVLFEEANLMSK